MVSTYLDALHTFCLKNDPAAMRRVRDGIAITRALEAGILMLVFFGKCALTSRAEMDAVTGPLRELVAEARRAGVTLGFENTIPAGDDLRILDAVASPALQIYYDIGNAVNLYHVDPAREIRLLRGRICQFHFKDRPYLGQGGVDVRAALGAIEETGWSGAVVLETGSPSKDVERDLRRNREYLLGLLRQQARRRSPGEPPRRPAGTNPHLPAAARHAPIRVTPSPTGSASPNAAPRSVARGKEPGPG